VQHFGQLENMRHLVVLACVLNQLNYFLVEVKFSSLVMIRFAYGIAQNVET
jgi:hypothetical protein